MGCIDCENGLVEVETPQPKSGYDVAKEIFSDESSKNATRAAAKMKAEGWTFIQYDEFGEPTYIP